MNTNQPVIIYISASPDLAAEREALARMIAELPVTLAWRIVQTPTGQEQLDLEALQAADLHFLIMGGDIRAPVGWEWQTAYRAGKQVIGFLKQEVAHTPAGQVFIRQTDVNWQRFTAPADLSRRVQRLIAGRLVRHALHYKLTPAELEQLEALLSAAPEADPPVGAEGTGRSAVILSRERYTPGEGVIIED